MKQFPYKKLRSMADLWVNIEGDIDDEESGNSRYDN